MGKGSDRAWLDLSAQEISGDGKSLNGCGALQSIVFRKFREWFDKLRRNWKRMLDQGGR